MTANEIIRYFSENPAARSIMVELAEDWRYVANRILNGELRMIANPARGKWIIERMP